MPQQGDLATFLSPLCDALPEELDILLWVLNPENSNDHSSFFIQTIKQAQAIAKKYERWHVYYGVGLRAHQPTPRPRWRGGSADVQALWILHGDVDIAHPTAHKNTRLPPDEATARRIVEAIELPPSFLIHSGYGLQPCWAFKEPEALTSTEDRFVAQEVAKRLHAALSAAAQQSDGYTVDATHDLSRVLRLPGTQNNKMPGSPMPCRILEKGPLYAGLGDFLDVLPEVKPGMSPESLNEIKGQTQGLTLESGEVNPEAFMLLMEESKFKKTWEKRRSDLKDGSQSSYDFSVVLFALHAGWAIPDALALMRTFRRKYSTEHRLAYYLYTITKAAAVVAAREDEVAAVAEYAAARETLREQEGIEADRVTDAEDSTKLFQELGVFLGTENGSLFTQECRVKSIAWTQNGQRRYYHIMFDTPSGEQVVRLTETQIFEAREVRIRCGPAIQYIDMKPLKQAQPQWVRLLNRLFAIMNEEAKEELIFTERLRSILSDMAHHCPSYSDLESYRRSVELGESFVFERVLYARFDAILTRIKEFDREWTRLDLSTELPKMDQAKLMQVSGVTRRVRYWAIAVSAIEGEKVEHPEPVHGSLH